MYFHPARTSAWRTPLVCTQDPPPDDALMTSETLAYLEACHLLFEQGLLSHECIRGLDSQVLKNISKGYEYFSGWLTSILDKGKYIEFIMDHCVM